MFKSSRYSKKLVKKDVKLSKIPEKSIKFNKWTKYNSKHNTKIKYIKNKKCSLF